MADASNGDDEGTFRILIATDSHVGYNEKDKIRGNDAMNTFEEILHIARTNRVDMLLHGGDLFHDNKPSRGCLYKIMDLLRRYCMGPGEINFQVVSDPALFSRGLVNYEDPNVNIEIPFFMIHGNHDDPGGESNLCAANLLEMASLVNYFGRSEDLEDIAVKPVLLRKGRTQVAIYGLGNIRDERLHRAFQNRKVRFETPPNPEQWFNIMILHQNRSKGNKGGAPQKSCIYEEMMPNFLDLVIWGHEHDCLVSPQESLRGEFYVVQPGSSVATALTPGETALKHVAIIEIRAGCFRCTPVPLWTVRPLVMREIVLSETGLLKTDTQAIWSALTSEIDAMIHQGTEEGRRRKGELAARGKSSVAAPELPLVRLRVEHSGFDTISNHSFGHQFIERVANPDDVLLFHKRGMHSTSGGTVRKVDGTGDILEIEEVTASAGEGNKIQDIIYKYIEGEQNLQILSEPDLNDAVQSFVHRSDPCAIDRFVQEAVESTNQAVLRESHATGEEEIRVQIQDRAESMRQKRLAGGGPQTDTAGPQLATNHAAAPQMPATQGVTDSVKSDTKVEPPADLRAGSRSLLGFPGAEPSQSGTGKGRGRGRGGGRGRAVKRQAAQEDAVLIDSQGPPASKVARSHHARASASASTTAQSPGQSPAQPGKGAREILFGGPQLGGDQTTAATGHIREPTPGGLDASMPPPFIQKRAANNIESVWGPDTAVADVGASLRMSQGTKRQWALKGPTN